MIFKAFVHNVISRYLSLVLGVGGVWRTGEEGWREGVGCGGEGRRGGVRRRGKEGLRERERDGGVERWTERGKDRGVESRVNGRQTLVVAPLLSCGGVWPLLGPEGVRGSSSGGGSGGVGRGECGGAGGGRKSLPGMLSASLVD